VQLEVGKVLIVRVLGKTSADSDGNRTVTFEINGQRRSVEVCEYFPRQPIPTFERSNIHMLKATEY
jgi:pyruvate carboxylase